MEKKYPTKTKGEIMRNNWNSINEEKNQELKKDRINFQNRCSTLTKKEIEFYEKYMWNKQTEKMMKKKFGKKYK